MTDTLGPTTPAGEMPATYLLQWGLVDDQGTAGAPIEHTTWCPCHACTGEDYTGRLNRAYRERGGTDPGPQQGGG